MKHAAVIALAVVVATSPAGAFAFVAPLDGPPPGTHRHDGFYLRLGLGANYVRTSGEVVGDTWAAGGPGLLFDVAMGTAVKENLVLFAQLVSYSASKAVWQDSGVKFDWLDSPLHAYGLGTGVVYYLMPANVHLGGSLLWLHLAKGDVKESRSRGGLGVELRVGKEVFVKPQVGLGLSAHVLLGRASWFDEDFDTWAIGLSAVATIN